LFPSGTDFREVCFAGPQNLAEKRKMKRQINTNLSPHQKPRIMLKSQQK
jgi:hypothetical protein